MDDPRPNRKGGKKRFRKLRIAWSVGWGVACLLLVALWVRSYWRSDHASWGFVGGGGYSLASAVGEVSMAYFPPPSGLGPVEPGWQSRSVPADGSRVWWMSQLSEYFGFRYRYLSKGKLLMGVRLWLLVAFSAALAASVWIKRVPSFSLRTLLVAMTLVAVGLGWIVYAMRT